MDSDIAAIREAMNCADGSGTRKTVDDRAGPSRTKTPTVAPAAARPDRRTRARRTELARDDFPAGRRFGSRFGSSRQTQSRKSLENKENIGGKGGTRTLDPGIMSAVL